MTGNPYAVAMARLVGINHVAVEVGDLDDALAFFGRIFDREPVEAEGTLKKLAGAAAPVR